MNIVLNACRKLKEPVGHILFDGPPGLGKTSLAGIVAAELAGSQSIPVERLARAPAALARLLVIRLAEQATGTYAPQAGERVAEIIALGRRGGSAELHVGAGAGAVIEDGMLRMRRLEPRAPRVTPPAG